MRVNTPPRTAKAGRSAKASSNKRASADEGKVARIMSAPTGPRTISHTRVKQAVQSVIRTRAPADA